MRNLKHTLSVALASQLLFLSSGQANMCVDFYAVQARAQRPSVSELLAAKLRAEPNGYPDFLISEVLRSELVELQNAYLEMIEVLSTKGKPNSVTWVLESTNSTLAELGRISKLLEKELRKESRRDENAIASLSRDLQRCSGNIAACSANLPQAITDSARRIREATNLVTQLNERANDVERLLSTPEGLQSIPKELHDSVQMALESHKGLIANYVVGIEAALTLFRNSEILLRKLAPDLVAAEYEIALLQAKGAHIKDTLALAPNHKAGKISSATGYPNFAKLFDQPRSDGIVSSHLADSVGKIDLLRVMNNLRNLKKLNPNMETRPSAVEIREIILKFLRNRELVMSHELRKEGILPGRHFTIGYVARGSGNVVGYGITSFRDIWLLLLFVKGNGPHLFKENLNWMIETIEAVRSEVQNEPRSIRSYLSINRAIYIRSLEQYAKTYRDLLEDSSRLIGLEASLSEYQNQEIVGILIRGINNSNIEGYDF